MRFLMPLLLLAATITPAFTKPLPIDLDQDIYRRWSQGESEASIHATHNIRDATPAWPVVRSYADEDGDSFAFATDERTMEMRRFGHRKRSESTASPSLMAKMKSFVTKFYRDRGDSSVLGKRSAVEVEGAPVLKPRGPHRYQFRFDA